MGGANCWKRGRRRCRDEQIGGVGKRLAEVGGEMLVNVENGRLQAAIL